MKLSGSFLVGSLTGASVAAGFYAIMYFLASHFNSPNGLSYMPRKLVIAFWPAGYGFAYASDGIQPGSASYVALLAFAVFTNIIIYGILGGLFWLANDKSKLFYFVIAAIILLYWKWVAGF